VNDEDLRILIQKVARRIRNNRASEDLSDSQLGVLFRLEEADHTPGALAGRERVSPPSMNRTLNGLEKAGFIARHPAEDDARSVRVTLTDAGRSQIAQTRAARSAWFRDRMDDLSNDERASLEAVIPVLRRLADE
jgi:DNA-binding MarR family transcriptional regulator